MEGLKIFLDSGAYSAHTKGVEINIDEYIGFIHENKETIELYANLDDISSAKISYDNWKYMRSNGLQPMPVYHEGDNKKYLKKYLDEMDQDTVLAIGGVADKPTSTFVGPLDRTWNHFLSNSDGSPIVKTHGFGITSVNLMFRYPWYCLDSTTWIRHAAYGKIIVPSKNNIEKPIFLRIGTGGQGIGQRHADKISNSELKWVQQYIQEQGFEEQKLRDDYEERAKINMRFFTDFLEKHSCKKVSRTIPNVFINPEKPEVEEVDLHDHKLIVFMGFASKQHNDLLEQMQYPNRIISYYYFKLLKKYNTLKELFYEDQT